MDSSSSASSCSHQKKVQVPLILCSLCKEKIIVKRISKTIANQDRTFYTCLDHEKDGSGCNFWFWEEGYMNYLKKNSLIVDEEATDVKAQVAAGLKNAGKLDEAVFLRQDDEVK